jgi:hypothetical protein
MSSISEREEVEYLRRNKPEPVHIDQRDYERCVNCGHIIGWHFKSSTQCEHRPGIGEGRDCQCRAALCESEAEAIKNYIAANKNVRYIMYMTGLRRKVINEYTEGILHLWHNKERWVQKR